VSSIIFESLILALARKGDEAFSQPTNATKEEEKRKMLHERIL